MGQNRVCTAICRDQHRNEQQRHSAACFPSEIAVPDDHTVRRITYIKAGYSMQTKDLAVASLWYSPAGKGYAQRERIDTSLEGTVPGNQAPLRQRGS